jgi:cobalt/nickel transport system permease protein
VHIPDGFINATTSLGAGLTALGGFGVATRKAAGFLEDRQVPLAGLTAAFVFAVQMLNFPVAAGTSGHLLGGVLAAVMVGPWVGALCMSIVVLVQALFADGGLSALGLNVVNIALIPALVGYSVFALLRIPMPNSRGGIVIASGIASGVSVVIASAAFVFEYALGGNGGVAITTVAAAMIGVHLLIAIGEGLITAAAVGLVLGVRPDLVHGAAQLPSVARVGGTAQTVPGSQSSGA